MNTTNAKTLIVGATSQLGRLVTARLLREGRSLRLMTRRPEALSHYASRAEIVVGDLRQPGTLKRACQGVSQVFSAAHSFAGAFSASPERADLDGHKALIDAARSCGVESFIFTSIIGASAEHPVDFFRIKQQIEAHLAASGLQFSIIRPAAFMESWARPLGIRGLNAGFAFVEGTGDNPINFVAARDVAAVAVRELGQRPCGEIIDVPGPENLTFCQVIHEFERLTDLKILRLHVPVRLIKFATLPLFLFSPKLRTRINACVDLHAYGNVDSVALSQSCVIGQTRLAALIPLWIREYASNAMWPGIAGRSDLA
jgi:uncharacterized protein YbjT (DUF2867 family)